MTEAKLAPNLPDWMVEHTKRYLSSGGTEGHMYKMTPPGRQDTTNEGAPDGRGDDDGVRQLWLGRLLRRSRVGRGDPAGPARRRFGLRLPVVGGAPFQRLLVRARQSPADDLPDGDVPQC